MQKMMEISKIIKEVAASAIKVIFCLFSAGGGDFTIAMEKKLCVQSKEKKFGATGFHDVFNA